jgi:hypothetical protein
VKIDYVISFYNKFTGKDNIGDEFVKLTKEAKDRYKKISKEIEDFENLIELVDGEDLSRR